MSAEGGGGHHGLCTLHCQHPPLLLCSLWPNCLVLCPLSPSSCHDVHHLIALHHPLSFSCGVVHHPLALILPLVPPLPCQQPLQTYQRRCQQEGGRPQWTMHLVLAASPPLVVSFAAQPPCVVSSAPLLFSCCPPPDCLASSSLPLL